MNYIGRCFAILCLVASWPQVCFAPESLSPKFVRFFPVAPGGPVFRVTDYGPPRGPPYGRPNGPPKSGKVLITKLRPDGSLDLRFGKNGGLVIQIGGMTDVDVGKVLLHSNALFVIGAVGEEAFRSTFPDSVDPVSLEGVKMTLDFDADTTAGVDIFIAKYSLNGVSDQSFGDGGIMTFPTLSKIGLNIGDAVLAPHNKLYLRYSGGAMLKTPDEEGIMEIDMGQKTRRVVYTAPGGGRIGEEHVLGLGCGKDGTVTALTAVYNEVEVTEIDPIINEPDVIALWGKFKLVTIESDGTKSSRALLGVENLRLSVFGEQAVPHAAGGFLLGQLTPPPNSRTRLIRLDSRGIHDLDVEVGSEMSFASSGTNHFVLEEAAGDVVKISEVTEKSGLSEPMTVSSKLGLCGDVFKDAE